MIWYKNNNSDIVVSTRIRLARNVDKTPFPNALKDTKEVTEKIKNAVLGGNSTLQRILTLLTLIIHRLSENRSLPKNIL